MSGFGGGGFGFGGSNNNNSNQSSGFGGFGSNNNTSSGRSQSFIYPRWSASSSVAPVAQNAVATSLDNGASRRRQTLPGLSVTMEEDQPSELRIPKLRAGEQRSKYSTTRTLPGLRSSFHSDAGANLNTTGNNAGGGLFGSSSGGTNSNTFGGFGSNNQSGGFGAKTGFGSTNASTSSGGLFGNNNATSGASGGFGGGFGSTNTASNSGFGNSNTSAGGLFGQSKPAFGASGSAASGGLFGSGNNTAGANQQSGFGSNASPSFGNNNTAAQNTGTGGTPFSAFQEKDGPNNVAYQSITFQPPYANFSYEELRLADYSQGRRFGNQNGQAGAFGQTTGFGGFGSNNSGNNNTGNTGFGTNNSSSAGLFGSNNTNTTNNSNSLFGGNNQQNNNSTGFGSNSGGGLFGANKSTGGLFGSNTATSGTSSGGLFGTSNSGNAFGGSGGTGGFGTGTNTGGGLFGAQNQNNQNQTQNKGLFGSTPGFGNTANTGSTGFGQNATSSGGGLFGNNNSNTTSTAFGNNQQKPAFSGFGQNANQNQSQTQSGGLFGSTSNTGSGGLFGNTQNQQQNQQKSGGLFGGTSTGTGTGLFGANNNQQQQSQQQGGGLFGNSQQNTGGLFGQKPAATGTSLFGGTAANNQGSGGGLFGGLGGANQQQQNQAGSSLFGGNNQNKSLFGAPTNSQAGAGTSLFGGLGQNNNATANNTSFGNSLFSGGQNQQPNQNGGSLFGSMQQPQRQSVSALTTSLNVNPYGHEQLFANLSTPSQSIGPLATPLSNSVKAKRSVALPQHRVNPSASSRLITPQKKTAQGFGFSYHSYGTPGSAVSSPGNGYGNSLLGNSTFGRSLNKSMSMSNLRYSQNAEDTILAPGAFSTNSRTAQHSGALKRLNVDRGLGHLHAPLFGNQGSEPTGPGPKKRVSFGPDASGDAISNGVSEDKTPLTSTTGALTRIDPDAPAPRNDPEPSRSHRSSEPSAASRTVNGATSTESQQVNGNELDSVPEEESPKTSSAQLKLENQRARLAQRDQKVGAYWTQPTLKDLKSMPIDQLKSITEFSIGREGAGKIVFDKVDLSDIPLDSICGGIVVMEVRSATVYGSNSPVQKPTPGKGLNVPSTITLENSFPRAQAGRLPVYEKKGVRFDKHIERLARVKETEFVNYDRRTGEWTFRVQHYTTYGLDYEEGSSMDSSIVAAAPDTPTPKSRNPGPRRMLQVQRFSPKNSPATLPGGFDDEDAKMEEDVEENQSFLDERSVGSLTDPEDDRDDVVDSAASESGSNEDLSMAGGFPSLSRTMEQDGHTDIGDGVPRKSILKSGQTQYDGAAVNHNVQDELVVTADWTEQLQRTCSPRKIDRQALRESQAVFFNGFEGRHTNAPETMQPQTSQPFATGLDLMNSLFGAEPARKKAKGRGRSKKQKQEMSSTEKQRFGEQYASVDPKELDFHLSFKPTWGPNNTLIYAAQHDSPGLTGGLVFDTGSVMRSDQRDLHVARLAAIENAFPGTMREQKAATKITTTKGVPLASVQKAFSFSQFAPNVTLSGARNSHERRTWQLASILFDKLPSGQSDGKQNKAPEWRRRKDLLCQFWLEMTQSEAEQQAYRARSAEERALAALSCNNVSEACAALLDGSDIRLATMIAQLSGDKVFRREMSDQIDRWRDMDALSEMTRPIRALYSLLAGQVAVCEGKGNAGPENKAVTFQISSQFNFDWRRAFGLRLWYGILKDEPIEAAVEMYAKHMEDNMEDVRPLPWYLEASVSTAWEDPAAHQREDILWGLLKLYASQHRDTVICSLPEALSPENVSGNPLDARLSFQLIHLLMGCNRQVGDDREVIEAADAITSTYASALATASPRSLWLEAVFVLLHLSPAATRQHSIRNLLDQHASDIDAARETPPPSGALQTQASNGQLSGPDTSSPFAHLTQALQIPSAWLYQSKALHARAVTGDRAAEVRWLGDARDWDTAHAVLCSEVAPRAVLEQNLDSLRELLGAFMDAIERSKSSSKTKSASSGSKRGASKGEPSSSPVVEGWNSGGGVYYDFIHLIDLEQSRDESQMAQVLQRLVDALGGIASQMSRKGLLERAALSEMGRFVADKVFKVDNKVIENANVLALPLTEDAYLKHTRALGLFYYQTVLAGGR